MGLKNQLYKIYQSVFPLIFTRSKLKQFSFEKLGNFREDDVFLVGYPKSGNTLLQHLIAHLVYKLPAETPKNLINVAVTEYYNNPYYFRLDKRHYFKSHELPKPHFKNVIYIVRDGRDAVLSYYHMRKNLNLKASIKEMYENGGNCPYGNWNNHIVSWYKNPYSANILFIKYEDLLLDKESVIVDIVNFLNLKRTQADINLVMEATSFESMKNLENTFAWQEMKKQIDWKPGTNFVRSGKKNSYISTEVSSDYIKSFENISKEAFNITKYDTSS